MTCSARRFFNPGETMKIALKSTLLVSLLAGAGITAHAEGFSFYALIDGGIASTSLSGGKTGNTTTSEFITGGVAPNFFGLTAEKSLEKGYSAGIKLETGFLLNPTNSQSYAFGGNTAFNRQANLYVSGSAGKLVVGTQPNFAFNSILMADPRAGSNYGSALAAADIDGGLNTIETGSISYTSPVISGFTFAGQFIPQNNTSAGGAKSGSAFSAVYSADGLGATVASYTEAQSTAVATATSGTVGGLTYKFGDFTAKGLVLSQKNMAYSKLNTSGIGGSYALNPATSFDLGFYNTKDSATNYNINTAAVGVYYKFLKDLTVYGQYANVKNSGSKSGFANFTWSSVASDMVTPNQTASTVNVGLLYGFF
jgi:predicted porin